MLGANTLAYFALASATKLASFYKFIKSVKVIKKSFLVIDDNDK
jgi:hypothetical protein